MTMSRSSAQPLPQIELSGIEDRIFEYRLFNCFLFLFDLFYSFCTERIFSCFWTFLTMKNPSSRKCQIFVFSREKSNIEYIPLTVIAKHIVPVRVSLWDCEAFCAEAISHPAAQTALPYLVIARRSVPKQSPTRRSKPCHCEACTARFSGLRCISRGIHPPGGEGDREYPLRRFLPRRRRRISTFHCRKPSPGGEGNRYPEAWKLRSPVFLYTTAHSPALRPSTFQRSNVQPFNVSASQLPNYPTIQTSL
jgi:hypothetical protein